MSLALKSLAVLDAGDGSKMVALTFDNDGQVLTMNIHGEPKTALTIYDSWAKVELTVVAPQGDRRPGDPFVS